ncbi:MAG: hypothetical protein VX223_11090, partial [Myxococcota bacterium]|nr:hypothetical protein [Myxococcota bacterium]
ECPSNYTGFSCDSCANGWIGEACDECPPNYTGTSCDTCANGWVGAECNVCPVNYIGSSCAALCTEDVDCTSPTNLCVMHPGASVGYCSIPCTNDADCTFDDWTCNVVGSCESPLATWCGPADEPANSNGIIKACP